MKSSKISGKILINGNSGWANAKIKGVCSGSGTVIDPYIIEDLVIDGGGSESCILIQNSDVYFKIINCTLSNSGEDWGEGGIKLSYIENGNLINNSVTFCYEGIILLSSNYINISGNTANSNTYVGIGLWYSHYNIITENTFRYNGWGISLESSNNNNITENMTIDNNDDGIGIWNSINNFVLANDFNDNGNRGVFLYNSDRNYISGNDLHSNSRGIYLEESDRNVIARNNIRNNYIGIEISKSKCNDLLNNTFALNSYNTRGTQDECVPDPTEPIPIEFILIPVMIIVTIVLLAGLFKMKRRPPPHKGISSEEFIKEEKLPEKTIKRFKEEIIIRSEVKEISKEQTEDIISPQINDCIFCGFEISDEAIFCPQCGNKIKK